MENQDRPLKEKTVLELINQREYAKKFINETNKLINATGGWIAREANWYQIDLAKKELVLIENELKFR